MSSAPAPSPPPAAMSGAAQNTPKTPATPAVDTEDENRRVAAIIAAVTEFRNNKS